MKRSRHILAAALVTTALCASQLSLAAPAQKTPVAEMAARLVVRLSETFCRSAPAKIPPAVRFEDTDSQPRPIQPAQPQQLARSHSLSPFQFRLPPPGGQC